MVVVKVAAVEPVMDAAMGAAMDVSKTVVTLIAVSAPAKYLVVMLSTAFAAKLQ